MSLDEREHITLLMMVGWGNNRRSHEEACHLFNDYFHERQPISRTTVGRTVQHFMETGSVSDRHRSLRFLIVTVNEAYDIMKSCLSDLQSQQPTLRDDYAVYGENVANRLRKIKNPLSLCKLQNAIDNLIFQAEMKELEEMQKENERPAPSHPPEHGSTDVSLLMGTSLLDLPDNFSHL
ncbi:hypothetical protein J6590_070986 [Homalodisca vitripennis]|nr:hypothetical protein J6590_070986 [Homalodisca vitripennis]